MTEIAWHASPLVKATGLHGTGDSYPYHQIIWADDELAYAAEVDSVTFDVELISISSSGDSRFRITVESVDENDNTKVVHPTQTHNVNNNQPISFTLAVPLTAISTNALTRFKVTMDVFEHSTLAGTEYWEGDAHIFSALYVPIIEIAKEVQKRCFIATAAYGSELAPPVQFLREFRDDVILKSRFSSGFEKLLEGYYWFSPPIAKAMIRNKPFKYFMKYTVVWPFIATVGVIVFIIKLFSGDEKGPASR